MMMTHGRGHSAIKAAATLTTAAVAITTTLNVSTAKFTGANTFNLKVATLTSRILGNDLTHKLLDQSMPGLAGVGLPPQGITPFGVFNQSTFGGIGVLIVDYVIHMIKGVPYYNSYASPFIRALGIGLLAGGVIGGLLDPVGSIGTRGSVGASVGGGFAMSNATAGRSVMGFTGAF
jgi:hypothetical protein